MSNYPHPPDSDELLSTKLTVPHLRASIVTRAPLLRRLDEGRTHKLTLISAPAGFGKTTLVSEWIVSRRLRDPSSPIAWVSLDPGDDDPVRFWRYVLTASQVFEKEISQSALALVNRSPQPPFEALLTGFINQTALLENRADRGGLVAQPVTGLHQHVAGIDFFSMYAQIMARFNISPETVVPSSPNENLPALELGVVVEQHQPGLVPQTVAPILKKRKAIKTQLAHLDPRDCRVPALEALSTALKWLLLVGFGYMGYKRFRWGRVEAHEAVTAFGRRALLQAKQTAEAMGFEVIYFNVDGLYVKKENATQPHDFQPLLETIEEETGLAIALDAVFDWIAFLPSRQNEAVLVANRFFGVPTDSSGRPALKVRGLEVRRQDTPPFVSETQTASPASPS